MTQVDPFLYKEQMMLYNWRGHFLDQYSCFKYRYCKLTVKYFTKYFIYRLTDEEGFVLVYQFDQVVEEALCPFAFTSRFSIGPSHSSIASCCLSTICNLAAG